MNPGVFVIADQIIAPLGFTTGENFSSLLSGRSGVSAQVAPSVSELPFYASLMPPDWESSLPVFPPGISTKFEKMVFASVNGVLQSSQMDPADPRLGFILSTTKGNIELLEQGKVQSPGDLQLFPLAAKLAKALGFTNTPLVISNACISGLLAILIGKRMIASGKYDRVIVCGADVVTKFVLSGFQSFQAVSDTICRPFDKDRNGINLGEAAATVLLSGEPSSSSANFSVLGGASSNDANHISGPSRTGEELAIAIKKAMGQSMLSRDDLDFVSAHGTATPYNDEMEAKAFQLAGLNHLPTNSLKGYYGHTLGAAGLLEAIIGMRSLEHGIVLPTLGFSEAGLPVPLSVTDQLLKIPGRYFLKTTAGFGGCNAAMVFGKYA